MRRLWTEDTVDHDGPRFHYEGVSVLPKPRTAARRVARRQAPSELRRVGRLGDGWLPSFCTPADAGRRAAIEEAAAAAGRAIDADTSARWFFYTRDEIPERPWS